MPAGRAYEVANRPVLLIRVPRHEQIEETLVAVQLQGVHRNTAVHGQGQITGRAPGGGVGRVRVLAGSGGGHRAGRGEAGRPCAAGGEPEAPGAALGGVVIDGSGLVRPGAVVAQQVDRNSSTPSSATSSGSGRGAPRLIWAS